MLRFHLRLLSAVRFASRDYHASDGFPSHDRAARMEPCPEKADGGSPVVFP